MYSTQQLLKLPLFHHTPPGKCLDFITLFLNTFYIGFQALRVTVAK